LKKERTISFSIKRLSNEIKRALDSNAIEGAVAPLTGMQCAVLSFVRDQSEEKDIFQRDLELEFNIRRSTATGILQLMEKNGLLKREPVSYDARLKRIVITEYGVSTHNKVDQRIINVEGRLKKNLKAEEIETFFRLLDKISDNIN